MDQEQKNPRNEVAHGTLLCAGGAYSLYMAWQAVQNTQSGLSSMSMTTTAVLAGALALGGALVLGYGLYILYKDYKKGK